MLRVAAAAELWVRVKDGARAPDHRRRRLPDIEDQNSPLGILALAIAEKAADGQFGAVRGDGGEAIQPPWHHGRSFRRGIDHHHFFPPAADQRHAQQANATLAEFRFITQVIHPLPIGRDGRRGVMRSTGKGDETAVRQIAEEILVRGMVWIIVMRLPIELHDQLSRVRREYLRFHIHVGGGQIGVIGQLEYV